MVGGLGAAEGDLGGKQEALRDFDFPLDLHQAAHAADGLGVQFQGFARHGTAGDFGLAHGGEFEVGQGGNGGIALGHHAAQLGQGFDEDDAGHQRVSGKMAGQEGLVAPHVVKSGAAFAGIQLRDFIHKTESGSVGQGSEGIGRRRRHGLRLTAPAGPAKGACAGELFPVYTAPPENQTMVPVPSSTHLLLIPSYNTGPKVLETVRGALAVWAPVWVVADGSDDGTTEQLERMASHQPALRVIRHSRNLGKGAAVLTGARLARDAGFTHVLSFDADGQHPADHIAPYMELSRQHPEAMVFGKPVFPDNAPCERVMGRKVANFWVDFQTGWWGIGDSMFGMRLFPVRDLIAVMEATWFGRRYDFECEAGIRLCWRGVPIINVPTPVRYLSKAEGGVSHYHYLRDNVRLVTLFLRHFPGAFLRWPLILARRMAGKSRVSPAPQISTASVP